MAIETDNPFAGTVSDLDAVGVAPSEFDSAFARASAKQIEDSLTPEGVDVPEIKLDVPTQAQISVKRDPLELQTFSLLDKEDPDAKSGTDMLTNQVNAVDSPAFTSTIPDYQKTDIAKLSKISNINLEGKTEEEIAAEEELDTPYFGVEPNLDPLTDLAVQKGKEYGQQGMDYLKDLYQDQFGTQSLQTTGSLGNLSQYGQPYSGGYLGTYPTQSSIGLSSAPPASLAGSSSGAMAQMASGTYSGFANLGVRAGTQTGLGTFASMGSSGTTGLAGGLGGTTGSNVAASSGRSLFGSAASVYGIYDGIKNKDYFSAGTSLIMLINPATAVPIAILQGVKMLMGAWSASKRPKPRFGGAEFKATKNSLEATSGWGYNGYQPSAGQATVASVSDYVNSYTKAFGLNFNGNRWADAIAADPKMNRYDSTDESGYRDPTVLTRKIFETDGLITGNPTYNGQAITSQEDYQKKMGEFNDWYKKTALENGGLVDKVRAGVTQDLSNEYKQLTFKNSTQVGGAGTGKNYTTKTTGGNRSGGGTQQTGYYEPGVGRNPGKWVPAASNVVTESTYSGGNKAYAINYSYEDATPFDMLYRNLVGKFNRGQGGTNY